MFRTFGTQMLEMTGIDNMPESAAVALINLMLSSVCEKNKGFPEKATGTNEFLLGMLTALSLILNTKMVPAYITDEDALEQILSTIGLCNQINPSIQKELVARLKKEIERE